MTNKGKIAAFCLIVPLSCGCNNNNNNNRGEDKMLKRDTYAQSSDELCPSIEAGARLAYDNQVCTDDEGDTFYYNIPKNGKIIANADIAISGSARIIIEGASPIELNNLDIEIDDTVVTSWDIDKGYVKFEDSLGGINYLKKDETTNTFWNCFPNGVMGTKYRIDVTNFIERLGGVVKPEDNADSDLYTQGLMNYVVIQSARNIGYFTIDSLVDDDKNIEGIGLDITGFGGENFVPERMEEKKQYSYKNISLASLILSQCETIDEYVPKAETLLKGFEASIVHKYTKENEQTPSAFSLELGFDAQNIESLVNVANQLLEKEVDYLFEGSGKGFINYFLNYKNNFIHQEEYVLNFKDLNFAMYPRSDSGEIIFSLKKANINGVINQNFNENECTPDEVNLSDYTPVE